MSYDQQEKIDQNLVGNMYPTNNIFQSIPQNIYQTAVPMQFAIHPSLIAQNHMPMYPVCYYPQNKPTHSARPRYTFNDQYVDSTEMQISRTKPSPIKSPDFQNKRHKFNETSDQSLNDTSNDHISSKKEGTSGLEIDSIFYELHHFAKNACTFAENVAQNYQKRPCFKKIDLLLSRLKHDLDVHNNIISNINSQGTAWAIKDFIFVFSRIVNAWIIMRGYIYSKTEDMDDLRKEYDADFAESFIEWEKVTLKMMKPLMGTVENFDILTQNKSGNKQKKKEVYTSQNSDVKQYDIELLQTFQKNLFNPKCAENSEEVQIRNHQTRSYFRAGVLKPLQIQGKCDFPSNPSLYNSTVSTPTTPDTDDLNWLSYEDISGTSLHFPTSASKADRLYNRKSVSLPVTPIDQTNPFDVLDKSRAKKDLSSKFNSMNVIFNNNIEAELEKEFGKLEMNEDKNILNDEEKMLEAMYKEDGRKIMYLINEVSKVSSDDRFTVCIDLIIQNVKNGKYSNLESILDEFKALIKHATNMMDNTKDDKNLLMKFVSGLESIINRKAFK